MLKAVLDTNQFVSSLIAKKGAPAQLLEAWRERLFILISSNEILEELRRVFHYPHILKKYHLQSNDIDSFIHLIEHEAIVIPTVRKIDIIEEDPDDNKILACALEGEADYIVSGDNHLLKLQQFQKTRIVPVREFLNILRS